MEKIEREIFEKQEQLKRMKNEMAAKQKQDRKEMVNAAIDKLELDQVQTIYLVQIWFDREHETIAYTFDEEHAKRLVSQLQQIDKLTGNRENEFSVNRMYPNKAVRDYIK